MWKKQWSKLKTALGTPEEYVTEEQDEEVVEEENKYNSDQTIEIVYEHFDPLRATLEAQRVLREQIGEMTLRHEAERARAVQLNSNLNQRWTEEINDLRSIYSVEPTVDYALNFPTEEGGTGTFVREPSE